MRACTTASGAVMYIPDEIEHEVKSKKKKKSVSYAELTKDDEPVKPRSFGKRKSFSGEAHAAA